MEGDSPRTAAGIARLKGHLMRRPEIRTARAEAEAFAARLSSLSSAQHDRLVRL